MITRIAAVLIAATLAADQPRDDAVKKEMEKLQGTWVCVSTEGDYVEEAKTHSMVVHGEKITVPKEENEATYKLSLNRTPKVIEMTVTKGPNKGQIVRAIYLLQNDSLRLCASLEADQLPRDFKGGAEQSLLTFKRKK